MNILFMSLSDYDTVYFRGLYSDLLRKFIDYENEVYIISPVERRKFQLERVINETGAKILKPRIYNMQKTNVIEKGISMLTIDNIFIKTIKKYLSNIKFDMVLYPTPPITLLKAVEYVKRRDGAKTYLLLKDIFPQNAVDIGMMQTSGLKGLIYRHFRKLEKKLYAVSDYIGCMSKANVDYLLKHNAEVESQKVEVCPNTTDPIDLSCANKERFEVRRKYQIPIHKTVFVYGGNLGKPQDIPYIINCLRKCQDVNNAFFLIVGSGTEYYKIEKYIGDEHPSNVRLMQRLSKEDYDKMIGSCDVGLIFLDHRFTIPNFPSRLLTYMQARLPVLAATDLNTDIGRIIVDGGFGWWCESSNPENFYNLVLKIMNSSTLNGDKAYDYLNKHYSSECAYRIIAKHF